MWLWKKFWNTDIIGKIYILIILFIIVVATMTVITRSKKARVKETTGNIIQNEITMSASNEMAMLNDQELNNSVSEEINSNEKAKIEETSLSITNNSNSSNNKKLSTKTETIPKEETKEKEETKVQEKRETIIKEQVKEEVKEQPKEEIKQETKKEATTNVPIKEEYKVNNEMINKMKSYIMNNPSETMQTYGFDVIIDSSITELTNQFTYTDQRLKDKLTHRFGTIRIYAMDYYYNGNLVMTECFIL